MMLIVFVVHLFSIFTSMVQAQSFLDVINQNNLTELSTTLTSLPDLLSQISNTGNVTFLAPTNDAFSSFQNTPTGQMSTLDPGLMRALLTYHLLQGALSITHTQIIPSMLNDSQYTNVTTGQVVGAGRFLTDVLFISGLAQNVTAVGSPLQFSGGVIYMIDQFLTLPVNTSATAAAANATSFINCSELARLDQIINVVPDSTILVPVNNAFEILGALLNNMTADHLTETMAYHIVNGTVLYETSSSFFQVPSSLGPDYNITVRQIGSTFFVNNARILVPDLLTANGVIHIIDQVLNPENRTVVELAASDPGLPAFANAYGVTTSTASTPAPTSPDSSGQRSASSSNTGAIIGGVVGGLIGLGLIIFLVWFVKRKGYNFRIERPQKSGSVMRLESDSKERYEMPDAKSGLSHEVDGDEKRLFEVPESGDRRVELPAMNTEPVEIDGDEVEVKPRDWKT